MKKLFTLACAFGISLFGFSQTFLSEDFSTFSNDSIPPLASGWKNIDSSATLNGQTWRFLNPGSRTLNAPISHPAAILDSDNYGSGSSQDAYLISPNFDASLATVVTLEFDQFYRVCCGSTADVEVFDGSTWTSVYSLTSTTSPDPEHVVVNISSLVAGVTNAQIRFHYVGSWDYYWILDNITVFQPTPDDIKAIAVDSLVNGCGLSNETIALRITNVGSTPVSNIPLQYELNGGVPVSETYAGTLNPGDTIVYSFTTLANMSTPGAYNITAYSAVRGDANPVNDTARGVMIHKVTYNSFPYYEDFEASNGGWTTGGSASSWAYGTPAASVINSAASGTKAWATNLTGNYNASEASYVIAPCFDFTSLAAPQFKMKVWWNSESGWDGAALQSSIDNGMTWQNVGAFGDPNNWYNDNSISGLTTAISSNQEGWSGRNSTGSGGWVLAEHDLIGLGGQSSVQLRVVFGSDGSVHDEGFAFDDVLIQDAPASDAGVIALVNPGSNCGLSATDTVKINIVNFGSTTIDSIPVGYRMNGGTPVLEMHVDSILPGDTSLYVFTTASVNVSAPGPYSFDIWTSLPGDGNFLNDSILNRIVNNNMKNAPYLETFDAFANGTTSPLLNGWTRTTTSTATTGYNWYANSGQTGSLNTGPTGDHTSGSGKYLYTEASNGSSGDITHLTSPCINPGAAVGLTLDFWYHMFGTEINTLYIEVGNNSGYTMVDSIVGSQQTAIADPFRKRSINITSFLGNGNISVRFSSVSLGCCAGDIAIDDFRVYEPQANDVGVLYFESPTSGCGLGTADSVRVCIKNYGLATITSFPISYVVNGATPVTETYTGSIMPGDTACYTFNATVNLSVAGTYNLDAYTSLTGDGDITNDSAQKTVNSIPILATFPYSQDFESGNGGWTSGGANSSWALGTPANTVINSAASGTQAWVTNLTGPYNASEQSYVVGPCFDFTSLAAPQFKMKVWWNSEFSWDGAVLQSSIDGGTTWQNVGAFGDPNNWYNDNSINGLANFVNPQDGWSGRVSSSNGSGGWVLAEHDLTGLGGVSGVLLRIAFGADASVMDEGFAFDDVLIMNAPANDVGVLSVVSPKSKCGLGVADTVKIAIKNFGSSSASNFPVSYRVNGGAFANGNFTGTIQPGDTAIYTFMTTANFSAPGSYSIDAVTAMVGDANILNDTLRNATVINTLVLAPITIDFNNLTSGQFGAFTNGWTGTSTSTFRWQSQSGATSSSNTGPSGDASGSGLYVYTEASSGVAGDIAWLTSPCVELNTTIIPAMIYKYHMFGATIDRLNIQIDNGSGFVTIDSIIGQQQTALTDPWIADTIDLSAYKNGNQASIRFEVIRGSSFTGDVSIDDVQLYDKSNNVLETANQLNGITVYPNPSNGVFNINIPSDSKNLRLEVTDISGKVVQEAFINKASNSIYKLDLSKLSKGIYLMKVSDNNYSKSEKLIIK
ncbi:MAG: T9SS type A sorting domain-containing protein [Flavobacteriales bacterium]|nr:T9SS type A sorting domain-containing protein [Flavobacteriales bacterium]